MKCCSSAERHRPKWHLSLVEMPSDRLAQRVVTVVEGGVLIGPMLGRIKPDWSTAVLCGLPGVPRPHMRMQVRIGVTEDLHVDPQDLGVGLGAGPFHRMAKQSHAVEELALLHTRKRRQAVDRRVITE